jgi:hypothetical protein
MEHPKNWRVAVMELFVDAQSPFSAGPEAAFHALPKTYPSRDVILVQYHEVVCTKSGQIAATNPLSSPDGDARCEYYRRLFPGRIDPVPTAIFNGKERDRGPCAHPPSSPPAQQARTNARSSLNQSPLILLARDRRTD